MPSRPVGRTGSRTIPSSRRRRPVKPWRNSWRKPPAPVTKVKAPPPRSSANCWKGARRKGVALRRVYHRASSALPSSAELCRDDGVHGVRHGRPALLGDLGGVVVEVARGEGTVLGMLPGVGEHDHIGLFDALTLVVGVLAGDVESPVVGDVEEVCDVGPLPWRLLSHQRGHPRGDAQDLGGRDIGVGGVVVGLGPFIGGRDVADVVCAVLAQFGSPGPELRSAPDDRGTRVLQPVDVTRGHVVLPARQCDIGDDMEFGLAELDGRGVLASVQGALPGEADPRVATVARVAACVPDPVCAVLEQGSRDVGVLGQQRGPHPGLRVPEDVPAVPVGGQARGRGRPWSGRAGGGEQVETGGADLLLEDVVTEDPDVAAPQPRPGPGIARAQGPHPQGCGGGGDPPGMGGQVRGACPGLGVRVEVAGGRVRARPGVGVGHLRVQRRHQAQEGRELQGLCRVGPNDQRLGQRTRTQCVGGAWLASTGTHQGRGLPRAQARALQGRLQEEGPCKGIACAADVGHVGGGAGVQGVRDRQLTVLVGGVPLRWTRARSSCARSVTTV